MELGLNYEMNERNLNGKKYSLISNKSHNVFFFQKNKLWLRITWLTFKLFAFIFFVIFIVGPLIYKYSYKLQNKVVFLNFVNLPYQPYDKPTLFGLEGTRNFYLLNNGVKLGVWHILPTNLINSDIIIDENSHENSLSDGRPVIIYNHGNSGSRGTSHRVELYTVLRKQFHVIAYDYRSYGDSSNESPSESSLVQDCIFMLKWVANRTNPSNIFVWGHSLGTSISTQALGVLQGDNFRPSGLILESPFNNFREEIGEFPLARLFRHLPWFTITVVEPMLENNFRFDTDKYILNVDIPILILHAEDDHVVPFKLGRKLYESAVLNRKSNQAFVKMVKFNGELKYGHKFICRAPELPEIIKSFIDDSKTEVTNKHFDSTAF